MASLEIRGRGVSPTCQSVGIDFQSSCQVENAWEHTGPELKAGLRGWVLYWWETYQ